MKIKITTLMLMLISTISYGQWVDPGNDGTGDVYYNNGNVGIGIATPNDNLHIQTAGGGVLRLSTNNTSYLSSQSVVTGTLRSIARQWNNNYSATNSQETSAIKFGYYAHIHGQVFNAAIRFYTQEDGSGSTLERMSIVGENVGIGTPSPQNKLEVNGTIRSKEIKVEASPWPDYVFADDYQLATLEETASYIKENHHLTEMPSAKEVETNGVNLGEMNMLLLKKIEELTLHLIEVNEIVSKQQKEIDALKANK